MSRLSVIGRVSALALLAGSGSAYADVTAAGVWADWKALMESYGQTVSAGSEEQSGNVLTIRNFTSQMEFPDGAGSGTASLDEIVMTERGDGTVDITMSPDYRILLSFDENGAASGGDKVDMTILASHSGLSMTASGTPEATSYVYAADDMTLTLEKVVTNGVEADADVSAVFSGVEGTYNLATEGDQRTVSQNLSADKLTISVDAKATPPDGPGMIKASVEVLDLTNRSTGKMVGFFDFENMAELIAAGFAGEGELGYGALKYDLAVDDNGETFNSQGSIESGSFGFAFSPDGLEYSQISTGIDISFAGSEIPLPTVGFSLQEAAFRLAMPVVASDEPEDAHLLLAYRGLTMSDAIWGLFDPGAVLPREPATVAFDLSGKMRWLIDIMDPEAAADMSSPPGELSEVTVNELELSVAGAALTGTGAFTFDNTDLTTFDGMPKPTGALDLQLVGGNGLMDKLIQMGLLPQDQAMGFRMMLGLFARPGNGEDTLVSKIEVTEDGKFIANGQPLN